MAAREEEIAPARGGEGGRASTPALVGWVLFDWAAQPFYALVTTFLFAPYFVSAFVGDAVRGQALWGYAAAAAGLLVAVTSPILGAIADTTGRRKPWVAWLSIFFALGMCVLWWAEPGEISRIWLVLGAFVIATAAAELSVVFINAMMPDMVPPNQIGRLSGIGWAVGYVGGLVSLIIMAGFVVTSPATGKTLLGLEPILSLDLASRESDRLSGPFSALWYVIFALPFFIFTRDVSPRRRPSETPVADGLSQFWDTLKSLPSYRDIMIFLIARMLYIDGLGAMFAFGGIYGVGVFKWQAFELGMFGILITVAGAIGAVIGGVLDDRVGSKRVILGALVGLLIAAFGILSVDATHVFFVLEVAQKLPEGGAFSSTGELVYLGFACLIGLVAGPLQSASRSFMARLAPHDKMTQFFGLFAFSGKVTSFLAPLAVGLVTSYASSQRAGVAVIVAFLVAGFVLMLAVRARGR